MAGGQADPGHQRLIRPSYLPPLMVYAAYGVSGLTGIVGTFFVRDYLDLSPAALAALAFWAGIPWALKMPVGHVVDLIWRWKALLVWLGAGIIAASLLIMVGLTTDLQAMRAYMSAERWYILAALLAPTGYMIQDAVADAMTVEAVPRVDDQQLQKSMHTTMQTLGRVAVIGGLALVAAANIYIFAGTENLPKERKLALYADVYTAALIIPGRNPPSKPAWKLRDDFNSSPIHEARMRSSCRERKASPVSPATMASSATSAAIIPLFMPVCTPLRRMGLRSDAESPTRSAPAAWHFGMEYQPPSGMALAP